MGNSADDLAHAREELGRVHDDLRQREHERRRDQRDDDGSVSATIGVKVGTGIGPFTLEASMEAWTSATTGSGYELTYSVDYTTMGRDAVVFTSVPYDVYEYEITRSADPSEVGQTLAFLFPRAPPADAGYPRRFPCRA